MLTVEQHDCTALKWWTRWKAKPGVWGECLHSLRWSMIHWLLRECLTHCTEQMPAKPLPFDYTSIQSIYAWMNTFDHTFTAFLFPLDTFKFEISVVGNAVVPYISQYPMNTITTPFVGWHIPDWERCISFHACVSKDHNKALPPQYNTEQAVAFSILPWQSQINDSLPLLSNSCCCKGLAMCAKILL